MSHFVSIETGIWPKDIGRAHVIDCGFTSEIRKPTALHNFGTNSNYRTPERSMYIFTILGLCTLVAALPRVKRQVIFNEWIYLNLFREIFGFFLSYFGRVFFPPKRSCITIKFLLVYCLFSQKVELARALLLLISRFFLQKSKYPSPFLLDLGWPYMPYFNLDYTCITVMCFFKKGMSARELILGLEIICPN